MGLKSKTLLVGIEAGTVIRMLNKAYADEWLAAFQYQTAALQITGIIRKSVEKELCEHAREEYEHAMKLAQRIQELGGTVLLTPEEVIKEANCAYVKPGDACAMKIIEQTIASEQCAISVYKRIMEETCQKDMITFQLAMEIMKEELEHEEEFQNFREDIQHFFDKVREHGIGCSR